MYKHAEEFSSIPLADMLTAVYMPEGRVSERTDTTRKIGAHALLLHLMEGDWGDFANSHNYEELLAEFMKRVSENAQRQGVELTKVEVYGGDVPSYIPYDILKCSLGEFDVADEKRKESWDRSTRTLANAIREISDIEIQEIVTKLGIDYGKHLESEGVNDRELPTMVEAFETKQLAILQNLVATGVLRQPDQDDHRFQHYIDDLMRVFIKIRS
jgi:arginyl-tRNA synthetase